MPDVFQRADRLPGNFQGVCQFFPLDAVRFTQHLQSVLHKPPPLWYNMPCSYVELSFHSSQMLRIGGTNEIEKKLAVLGEEPSFDDLFSNLWPAAFNRCVGGGGKVLIKYFRERM